MVMAFRPDSQFSTRLPNGKDQPWYFLSRLTSNKNYDNIKQNDRLLAIWLGKGYCHFTTSAIEKESTYIDQNINYPNDIDGLQQYVYYQYTIQLKKAIVFIKFVEDSIKSAIHNISHPKINQMKFLLRGKDNGRYPAFNGIIQNIYNIQNIYVSFQQGVNKETPEEKQGVSIGQRMLYKLMTTPDQRDPKAEQIQQVI
ncbi:hypothetical protein pb186bvf_005340 [Paramecium bursaria]